MKGMCHYCKHKIKNYDEEPCSSCRATDGKFDGIDIPSPWRDVREFLENTRMSHHYCDDSWYSCPKHPDGCANEELTECNCGADEYNKKLDEILKLLPAPPAGEE